MTDGTFNSGSAPSDNERFMRSFFGDRDMNEILRYKQGLQSIERYEAERFPEHTVDPKTRRVYISCERGVHNMGADFFDNILKMTFRILNVPNKFRVDLMFVSRDSIKQYNAEKRGVNKVTDVLSFPAIDYKEPLIPEDITTVRFLMDEFSGLYQLGEILICRSVCEEQAHEYGHSVEREMGYLFVHGVLHILGYDHITTEQYREMRDIEEKVLAAADLKR